MPRKDSEENALKNKIKDYQKRLKALKDAYGPEIIKTGDSKVDELQERIQNKIKQERMEEYSKKKRIAELEERLDRLRGTGKYFDLEDAKKRAGNLNIPDESKARTNTPRKDASEYHNMKAKPTFRQAKPKNTNPSPNNDATGDPYTEIKTHVEKIQSKFSKDIEKIDEEQQKAQADLNRNPVNNPVLPQLGREITNIGKKAAHLLKQGIENQKVLERQTNSLKELKLIDKSTREGIKLLENKVQEGLLQLKKLKDIVLINENLKTKIASSSQHFPKIQDAIYSKKLNDMPPKENANRSEFHQNKTLSSEETKFIGTKIQEQTPGNLQESYKKHLEDLFNNRADIQSGVIDPNASEDEKYAKKIQDEEFREAGFIKSKP